MEKTITLETPITVKNQTYSELKLREPVVNEVIMAARVIGNRKTVMAACDSQIDLLKRVSGWTQEAIDELPVSIMDEAFAYLTSFQEEDQPSEITASGELEIDPAIELPNGDHFTSLLLKEPTVGQRKKAMKQLDQYDQNMVGGLEFQVTLLGEVTGWKTAAILKLPIHYFMQASQYLSRFFTNGQETGEKSNAS